jgi:replicative DNA helicase
MENRMDEALIKRVLPHRIEAEQSVIGAMLMDREAIITASEIVTGEDFYQHQYGVMFDSMVELFNEGKPVDLVTLQNRLKEKDVPPEVSSLEFVRDIITTVPTSANVKSYAEIVREKAVLRRLIRVNEEISNDCYLGREPLEVILAETEKKIFDLLQSRNSGDFVPIRQVALNVLENIEKASKTKETVTGVPTGFIDLDYKTSGFQPSDLILIAARPSMGKTAFVLNVVDHITVRRGIPCMVFSLEMSKEQLVNRMLSMESSVDSQKLRTGTLTDSDWDAVVEGVGVIGGSKLIIDDTPGISITELRSKCRKAKLEHGIGMVIIDYLQLMTGSGRGSDSRQQEISEISRSLKALARELQAPVVALSQLSRACETRTDHRPMLSDLRESGAIEQDADVVMFLYRDDYYNKDSEMKDMAEVIIAKQRNGPIGTVNLVWMPQYTKFANATRQPGQ